MKNNLINKLQEQLKIDEGVKYEVYEDHLGYSTFGIGHLITTADEEYQWPVGTKVTPERVNEVFQTDVQKYIAEAQKVFPDLINKPDNIQVVLVNMCFNLGAPRLGKFRKFISAIDNEMMDSNWANQVGPRAERLKQIVLSQAD